MQRNVVFDLGMHRGEDTEFYLKKGFDVVGVEANPVLCDEVRQKFQSEISNGRLKIVNKAVAKQAGMVKLFINVDISEWSTLDQEWVERNQRKGSESIVRDVEAITMATLIKEFGSPYYLKIDIEGNDLTAVEGLTGLADLPKYISIESDKTSFRILRREISALQALGYDQFKLINQAEIETQQSPAPPKEGVYADHTFRIGSSGLFGEETPGRWLAADEAVEAYRPVFLRYALIGDDPLLSNRIVRGLIRRVLPRAGWYDTHARRSADR